MQKYKERSGSVQPKYSKKKGKIYALYMHYI
jgi:hypothetical protein